MLAHDSRVWETVDPQDRRVMLTFAAWRHICAKHPELMPFRGSLLQAIRTPRRQAPGRQPGEQWFYATGFGPTQFVKIAVHYEGDQGAIRTAFPRRRFP